MDRKKKVRQTPRADPPAALPEEIRVAAGGSDQSRCLTPGAALTPERETPPPHL